MKLLLKFTDESESFTLGCEFGRLLERFEKGVEIVENNGFPIHLKNKEIISKTCNEFGYIPIYGEVYFEDWIEFKALKSITKN